jgi:hypothetical protein
VLEDVAAWRSRPLERVYPIVYFGVSSRFGGEVAAAGRRSPRA